MFLKLFKSAHAYHFFLIPLLAATLWSRSFLEPTAYPFYQGEDQMLLYRPVAWLLTKDLLVGNAIALLMLIGLSFLIIRLNIQYSFIRIRTYLPASLFVLITSGLLLMHTLHPVYFAVLFLLLAIDRLFGAYENKKPHSNAFDSGAFIAIGSLFYLNLIFFFPITWIGFAIIQKQVNWREVVLSLIGFTIPWGFAVSYYAATNQLENLLKVLEMNFYSHNMFLRNNLPLQIYLGLLIVFTLLGSFFLLGQYDEKKISSRKYFLIFFWIFLIALAVTLFVPSVSQEGIILLAIPLTYLISNYLVFMKRQVWGELLFTLLLLLVVWLQFGKNEWIPF
jgi:hypothetical protein